MNVNLIEGSALPDHYFYQQETLIYFLISSHRAIHGVRLIAQCRSDLSIVQLTLLFNLAPW